MAGLEILLVGSLRAMIEVALLAMLGQGALALLTGSQRQTNFVYRVFQIISRPVIRAFRLLTPKSVIDRHLPYLAFFILFWLWLLLAYVKQQLCAATGQSC